MTGQDHAIDGERMWNDFNRLCDCGGRLLGTASELAARELLEQLGCEATGVTCQLMPVPYDGWKAKHCELTGVDGGQLTCHPLLQSPVTAPGGVEAEVIDLGRGTPAEFAAHAAEIPGRIVMVRHELMFAAGTIHRSFKYLAACKAGAAGFLIAGLLPDSPVSGSSGFEDGMGVPALGISRDVADALAPMPRRAPKVRLVVEACQAPAEAPNLIFDMPGQEDEWVVLSAHIDGHDLAESAIDNASGLAVALAVARALSGKVATCRRGLRLALFNVEEWALNGSAHCVASLSKRERAATAINVNIDAVGVASGLTALTSGFAGIEPFLLAQSERAGVPLSLFRPLQMNSDHGNFAEAGIPAFRLVSGFNDAGANTRYVLTAEDTRDKVDPDSLQAAARLTAQIAAAALDASPEDVGGWRTHTAKVQTVG